MPPWIIAMLIAGAGALLWKGLSSSLQKKTHTGSKSPASPTKKAKRRKVSLKTPNIFVSHRWEYQDDYYSLIEKFDEKGWAHIDYSVPSHDPFDQQAVNKLEAALREQVRQCNFFIVFANMAMGNSKWIEKEVKIAKEYEKYILAVKPWNYQGNIPQFIQDAKHDIVGFDSSAIIRRIETVLSK